MVVDDLAVLKVDRTSGVDAGTVARARSLRRPCAIVVGDVARHRHVGHAEAGIVATHRDTAAVITVVVGSTGDKAAGDSQRALVVLVGVGVVLPELAAATVIDQLAIVHGFELLFRAAVDDHLGFALDADHVAVAGAVELGIRRGKTAIDHMTMEVDGERAAAIVEHQMPVVLDVPVAQDIDGDRIDLIWVIGAREHIVRAVEHVLVAVAVVAARIGTLAAHVGNGIGSAGVVVRLGARGLHGERREGKGGTRKRKLGDARGTTTQSGVVVPRREQPYAPRMRTHSSSTNTFLSK